MQKEKAGDSPLDGPSQAQKQAQKPSKGPARGHGARSASAKQTSRSARLAKLFLIACLVLVGTLALAGVLLQGRQFESDAVRQRVQTALQGLVGDQYSIEVASSGIRLISATSVGLSGRDVTVTAKESGRLIVTLDEVAVGLDPRSVFRGDLQFDRLVISGGKADLRRAQTDEDTSPDVREQLAAIAKTLNATEDAFANGAIEAVSLEAITFFLPPLGTGADQQLVIEEGTLDRNSGRLLLRANGEMRGKAIALNAEWRDSEGDGRQLSFGLGDLPVSWWMEPAGSTVSVDEGLTVRVDGRIPYDSALSVSEPFFKLQSVEGDLTLGDRTHRIGSGLFNLRVKPETQSIEIESAQLPVDGVSHIISGNIAIRDGSSAAALDANPVHFDLSLQRGDEEADGIAISTVGVAMPTSRQITLDRFNLQREAFAVSGNASFGAERGLALSMDAGSGIVADLLAVWPQAVATRARRWLLERLDAARFDALALALELTPQRLGPVLTENAALADDEFSVTGTFNEARLRAVPTLPPVQSLDGSFRIVGNRLDVTIADAQIDVPDTGEISVSSAAFAIPALTGENRIFTLDADIAGSLKALASFASLEPINAFQDGSVDPASLTGNGQFALSLTAPIRRGGDKPVWKLNGNVSGFGSQQPIAGREIADADLAITADRNAWTAEGKARIDGLPMELVITEPIEGGSELAKREVRFATDTDQLAKRGIAVGPVISGPLSVRITGAGRGDDRYEIDLRRARLSLPWIDWSKSANSDAAATMAFTLNQSDNITTLTDFQFTMAGGRKASGTISVDKAGLRSLDLKGVTLNEGDDVAISVQRQSNRLVINANGSRFDARPILQMVIHGDGLGGGGAGADVSLTANFGRLSGFNGEAMETAIVRYETAGGRLQTLEVRGAVRGAAASILAYRQGSQTVFEFRADNAGASLAMVDLYRKMEGGGLRAKLARTGNGPFAGDVAMKDFTIVGEERLSALTAAPAPDNRLQRAAGRLQEINTQRVRFDDLRSSLVKADGRLEVKSGWIRNSEIGLTFDGIVFDENEQMNLRGTFMPLFAISRVIGEIPIIGDLLSNGRDSGLIGITYRLKGPANNPQIAVNPLSIVAPGVFREIFQFRE